MLRVLYAGISFDFKSVTRNGKPTRQELESKRKARERTDVTKPPNKRGNWGRVDSGILVPRVFRVFAIQDDGHSCNWVSVTPRIRSFVLRDSKFLQ